MYAFGGKTTGCRFEYILKQDAKLYTTAKADISSCINTVNIFLTFMNYITERKSNN